MTFEDQLRASLRRREAPEGFASRVAARAAAERAMSGAPTRRTPARGRPRWVALGMAASLALATASGLVFLERQKETEARRAQAQVIQALRIAEAELAQIRSRVAARADAAREER
jgi:hypothetical protein